MENFIGIFNEVLSAAPNWLVAITGLVTAASAVAALTPTPKDDNAIAKVLAALKKVTNLLALNVFNAAPKDKK